MNDVVFSSSPHRFGLSSENFYVEKMSLAGQDLFFLTDHLALYDFFPVEQLREEEYRVNIFEDSDGGRVFIEMINGAPCEITAIVRRRKTLVKRMFDNILP
ncbi:MAG: hypothetical protein Q7S18_02790 [bacterium]|nr:hypothetical protein [bacterium]